jgi:hypothetical protein
MNKFTIFTLCTHNYKDAFDFFLPTWVKFDTIESIYVYTDFEYTHEDPKVKVINFIKKTDNWLDAVGLRAVILSDFLKKETTNNIAFVDIDCYIREDISEIFDNQFDIAVTRMNVKNTTASAGIWFARKGTAINKFSKNWHDLQIRFKKMRLGIVEYKQSYSQKSFSKIVHDQYKINRPYMKVLPISVDIYNCEDSDNSKWIDKILKNNSKVIHFKGRRWRDADCMNLLYNLKII